MEFRFIDPIKNRDKKFSVCNALYSRKESLGFMVQAKVFRVKLELWNVWL